MKLFILFLLIVCAANSYGRDCDGGIVRDAMLCLDKKIASFRTDIENHAEVDAPIPQGMIVMWSGFLNEVPLGWALCDGRIYTKDDGTTIKTPDLKNRFILGSSSSDIAFIIKI